MILIFTIILINLLILIFHNHLAKFYSLYDIPDNIRKKHSYSVPLTGGIIIFFNIITFALINGDFNLSYLFFGIVFVVGVLDDKFDINPNKKLIYILAICLMNVIFLDALKINSLRFAFVSNFDLNNIFSYFFPAICILIFVNALNMFDGANLQVGTYTCFVFVVLFFYSENIEYLIYLIPVITFLILNHQSRSFLGDGGSIFLVYFLNHSMILIHLL